MPTIPASLADLLHPVTPEEFFAEHHGRRPLHVPGKADKFASLMSWDLLNDVLGLTSIWTGRSLQLVLDRRQLDPEEYCVPGVDRETRPALVPDFDKVRAWLRRGASLVCNDVDALTPGLRAAASALEDGVGGKAQANLYCSWRAHQGFGSHFDTHDVFALHVAGEKTWNLYGRHIEDPIAHPAFRTLGQAYHDANKGPLSQQVTLRPGDLLYLPRGWYHDALASSEATIHVAFGVTTPIGLDLVGMLYEAAVMEPVVRRGAPARGGDAALAAFAAEIGDRLASLARDPRILARYAEFARGFRNPRATLSLPGDALGFEFVAAPNLALSHVAGRWVLGDGKRGVPVPPGVEGPLRWMLGRGRFGEGDLAQAFPALDAPARAKLLSDLEAMKVLSRG